MVVRDVVRVQNRIKAQFRSRGVPAAGKSVYSEKGREPYLEMLPEATLAATKTLYAQYDAVQEIRRKAEKELLEIDIRKFFDTLDHRLLREVLLRRVRDGVLLRLIGKWLNAGVLEDGALSYPDTGTPQGGVISSILANIFLHEVLDTWFYREVTPRLLGTAQLYRYADDGCTFQGCVGVRGVTESVDTAR